MTELDFTVAIVIPYCSSIRLHEISLDDMMIDFGSIERGEQLIPELTDEFGLLDMGYCQDLEKEVEFDENSVNFLTTDGSSIWLETPQSYHDIGTKTGHFLVKDNRWVNDFETITIVLKVPFTVTISPPICDTIRLIESEISNLEINFGAEDEET